MNDTRTRSSATLPALLLSAALVSFAAPAAHAGCNAIPVAPDTFRSALGFANRPFAGPGENVEIAVRPDDCDGASPGLASQRVADYVVAIVFTPPGDATRTSNVVVLAPSCAGITSALDACRAHQDVASVTCVEANQAGGRRDLAFVERHGERRLMVRFPDTDALVDAPTDGRTLAGPATVAVTTATAPLPCGLARTRCADSTATPGLVACVDELYAREAGCGTAPADRDPTLAHFTALPPTNDYRTILAEPVPADSTARTEIRFALDAQGNALVPIEWRGALIEKTTGPITRQLRGIRTVEAFLGFATGDAPVGPGAVTSYDLRGVALPPMFRPDSPAYQETLFGTIDVPRTIVRIAGRICRGGAHAGQACERHAACGAGRCEALFDLHGGGVGPMVIPHPAAETDQRQACYVPAD